MDKLKAFFKRPQVWGFLVSVAVLAIVSAAFFYPDNFDGNVLRQPDMQQGAANGREGQLFEAATGEKALWTNALFSGMPTFQISPTYSSNSLFAWFNTVYGLGLPAPSNLLFMMMFGFLILLFTLKMRWYYALMGAIAWGFSSYFIIIIGAGHIWKFLALTYVPPTIAGILLLYRGRRLAGAAMLAFFAMMQLNANHPQMTYYFGIVAGIIALSYLIEAIRRGTWRKWLISSAVALGVGALALGANLPSLYNTYEYSKETKRSQSELTPLSLSSGEPAERPTGGMPYSQIVGWSYGRSEMLSLLVPNIKGGASARPENGDMAPLSLADLEDAAQYTQSAPLLQYMSQYFNDSEGTNGPVYVGALIFALFLAGCFVVKGPQKWWIVTATIVSVVLALGRNAETITDLMIFNFPLYNKFRAVESILVIAEFCMPLLAILTLERIVEGGRTFVNEHRRALAAGFGIPMLLCLLIMLAPSVFGSAVTSTDRNTAESIQGQIAETGIQQGYPQHYISQQAYMYSLANPANLEAAERLRYGMARADALRSLMFILIGACVLWLMSRGRLHRGIGLAVLGMLVLTDLYGVDKRYISHSSFAAPDAPGGDIVFTPDAIDKAILADTSSHYRVFDLPQFTEAGRSYFHKTLGGYHAAKLNRYEDIIQRRLMPVVQIGYFPDDPALDDPEVSEVATLLRSGYAVADMLNARYVITRDPSSPLVVNDKAMGNAWLVDSLMWVDNADDEMAALDVSKLDLRHSAVADRRFADALPAQPAATTPGDTIRLTSYTPNTLTYHASTANGGVAVFSEVYFPWGWHAEIDGKAVPIARVNYILRALALPAGEHTVSMTFRPESIEVTSSVAYACVTLIYLLIAAGLFFEARRSKLI